MTGPPPAVAAVRRAVRTALARHDLTGTAVLVACSGGADSLALAMGAGFEVPRAGGRVGAVVVDHQLQPGSASVAAEAARSCRALGLDPVQVLTVDVPDGSATGPEDAARRVRLEALAEAAGEQDAHAVLLGHTRDDQAEQVLLGLVRGSGTRSLSGMPRVRPLHAAAGARSPLLLRPLLDLPRETTQDACAAAGLTPWQDPHNRDERFTRVRARAALAHLHDHLDPGVGAALARSAEILRGDADALEELTAAAGLALGPAPWPVEELSTHHRAIRCRLYRQLARQAGSPAGALTSTHLGAIDDLLVDWHGQGPITVPGGVRVHRGDGRIWAQRRAPG